MKITYFLLFALFSITLAAQDVANFQGQDENVSDQLKLYPNPVYSDMVYVTTKRHTPKNVTIFDVFGKAVLTDKIASNTLNISKLVPGVYVLQVVQEKTTTTRKLVVK